LIPGRGKKFFSSPYNPDHLWGPPSLLFFIVEKNYYKYKKGLGNAHPAFYTVGPGGSI
jgi:hypothetical protein